MSKKKKKYYKVFSKKIPIYVGQLVFIASNDKKKIKKKHPDIIGRGEEPYAHAFTGNYKGWRGYFVLLNFDHGWSRINHGTVAHEAYHITSFIAESVGMKHDPENDEPMAYLHMWIVDELYKWIDKQGFKVYVDGR